MPQDTLIVRFTFAPPTVAEVEVEMDRAAWEALDDAERAQAALDQALDHGLSWDWHELPPPEPPTMAWVLVDEKELLRPDSTVTVGEWTWPVPEMAAKGGVMWWPRVGQALAERGWRPVRGADQVSRPNMVGIPVEKITEG